MDEYQIDEERINNDLYNWSLFQGQCPICTSKLKMYVDLTYRGDTIEAEIRCTQCNATYTNIYIFASVENIRYGSPIGPTYER